MDLILIGIIILLPLLANIKVNTTYSKYSKIENSMHMTGKDAAKKILERNGLSNVKIDRVQGNLTDHYDPRNKRIYLSDNIYDNTSIAAVSVAAHEVGHAIQDKEAYSFLRFRSSMVPVVNFTSRFATIFIVIGFISEIFNLVYIGIGLLSIGLLFQLITLPVEFNASSRAKKQLKVSGLMTDTDSKGMNKVLGAAALTYVASFLASAVQILRLVLISRRRN